MAEKTILVGVIVPTRTEAEIRDHLDELEQLVNTLDIEVIEKVVVHRDRIDAGTFIGRGKLEEIKVLAAEGQADEIVFDDDMSPTQIRNIEKAVGCEIIDRSGIILEIFARHARTREAKTQIELAMLEYLLPRLTRRWTHLERQVGGIGVRGGAGETQIEVDRRLIRTRISRLKKQLRKIEKERAVQRKGRQRDYRVSLVGYTNAGKSTLLNALTGSGVQVEDKLFATLDTTVRRCQLDKDHAVLLSDTVGFIRKLPPKLVASFRSTLRELEEADLLIKVVDISSPVCFRQLETVNAQLLEIGLHEKPSLVVFNKIDILDDAALKVAMREHPQALFVSARKMLRLSVLRQAILNFLQREEVQLRLEVPLSETKLIAALRNHTQIITEKYRDSDVHLELFCYRRIWNHLQGTLNLDSASISEIKAHLPKGVKST